ncbi:cytochrome b/b6 domain-containing protein [Sulfuricystis multivorans]|uniref:cytochrome b/b6 domain-containing protein n=1 Tax=Sulfuricystis multivorans TaxID=2211108 RepID=UPI000F83C193|nr:cytochrome b/b6 domain-containing protein [Sulfuricystis multivorans]
MRTYVWDLPTRLFHWLLVICVVAAFVTVKIGGNLMVWHGRLGLAILGLITFRIVWGFVGSTYARFATFVRGPAAIRAYLAGKWQGLGHNPLGALSVLALLGCLALQAGTGLFANDDIAFEGYLYPLVGSALSTRLTGIHQLLEKGLLLLVTLHVGAIAFYARVKQQNLVKPMLTGWAEGQSGESARGGGPIVFLVAVLIALAVVWAASGVWLPMPATPPAGQAAPDF